MVNVALLRVAVATGLAGIGLAAGGTGGALLATEIAGTDAVAGLPFAAVVAGSAAGAVGIAALTRRVGRRLALAAGYAVGVAGAVVVLVGASAPSLPLVLAGSVLLGPANAAVFLSRYAGAELLAADLRGRGMGVVLFAAAFGSILAPNLLGPAGELARLLGVTPAAGLYLVTLPAFGTAGLVLLGRARPPDRLLSPMRTRLPRASVAGLVVLGAANMAMVGVMSVAPVHVTDHGHGLVFLGIAISLHVAGMLLPSPVTGWVVDRIGPGAVTAAAAALFAAAGAWGGAAGVADPAVTIGFLLLLGLGWNLAVVAGSALVTSALPEAARPAAEAAGEVAMGAAAAVGAAAAGVIAAGAGWGPMMLAAGAVGALTVAGAWWSRAAGPAEACAPGAAA